MRSNVLSIPVQTSSVNIRYEILEYCHYQTSKYVLVADEGHILKNAQTALAKSLSKIKTRRRIVLTGTPLQNNLIE